MSFFASLYQFRIGNLNQAPLNLFIISELQTKGYKGNDLFILSNRLCRLSLLGNPEEPLIFLSVQLLVFSEIQNCTLKNANGSSFRLDKLLTSRQIRK